MLRLLDRDSHDVFTRCQHDAPNFDAPADRGRVPRLPGLLGRHDGTPRLQARLPRHVRGRRGLVRTFTKSDQPPVRPSNSHYDGAPSRPEPGVAHEASCSAIYATQGHAAGAASGRRRCCAHHRYQGFGPFTRRDPEQLLFSR